ncbi:Auxilin-like protein 1 [Morella rubra]|uniref:Auxilin-like protein 1 n=1 Tax=Morella rubra TaxID=262757 RepID=A0A6A1UPC6_9ROSI|nr:Auxilin-like protein 1 [Morella rubra]
MESARHSLDCHSLQEILEDLYTGHKKFSNGHNFGSKSIYDGVFSAPSSKFGSSNLSSRVLDYGEIFGGSEVSRGSSIPFLDVPALDGSNISFDVGSSELDYSTVFGGFGELDIAVSYEELISGPKKRNRFSEMGRSPAERGSPGEGADPANNQEKNQIYSNKASYESFDGVKKFSMSYNKLNQGGKNGTNGTTHIAQLGATPGYTCLIDEIPTLQRTDKNNPVCSRVKDAYLKKEFSNGLTESMHSTKVVTDLPAGGAAKEKCKSGVAPKNKSDQCRSNSIDMLFGTYEDHHGQSLKVSSSSSPSTNLCGSKGDFERPMAAKYGFHRSHFEGAGHVSSPPYFGEEVDANSVAAASVAALKKAIEEAQAQMKIAKESMARKKEGLQNRGKLGSNYGVKAGLKREGKTTENGNRYQKKDSMIYEKEDYPVQVSAAMRKQTVMREGHATEFGVRETPLGTKAASEETCGRLLRSTQADHGQEAAKVWHAAEQFYELVTTSNNQATMLRFEQVDEPKKVGFERPEESSERSNAVEEAHKQEEIEGKINALKVAVNREEHGGKIKSTQLILNQEENEERSRVVHEQEQSEEKVEVSHQQEKREEKLRDLQETMNYEEHIDTTEFEKNGKLEGWMEAQEQVENMEKGTDVCEEEDIQKEEEDAHMGEGTERRLNKVHEQTAIETRFNEFLDEQENGKSLKGNSELKRNEKLQEDGGNGKFLRVAYQIEEKRKRRLETYEWIEEERIEKDIDRIAEDEKRLEVAEEVLNNEENNIGAAHDQCKQDESENLSKNQKASGRVENSKGMELTLEVPANDENRSRTEVKNSCIEGKKNLKELEVVKDENEVKATRETFYGMVNLVTADDGHKQDGNEKLCINPNTSGQKQNYKEVEVTLKVPAQEENMCTMEVNTASFECKENGKEVEAVQEANDKEDMELLETVGLPQDAFELAEMKQHMEDITETLIFYIDGINLTKTEVSSGQKQKDQHVEEHKIICNPQRNIELAEIHMNVKEVEIAADQEEDENDSAASHKGKCVVGNNIKADEEEDGNNSTSSDEEIWADDGYKVKAAQLPDMFAVEGKIVEAGQEIKLTQSTGKHKTHIVGAEWEEDGTRSTSYHEERWVDDGYRVKADQDEDGNNSTSSPEVRWVDDEYEVKAAQLPYMVEMEGKSVETCWEIEETLITEKHEIQEVEADQEEDGSNSTSSHDERWVDDRYKVKADQEEDENNSMSSHKEIWEEDEIEVKAAQLADMFEGEDNIVETAQEIKATKVTEKHETYVVEADQEEDGSASTPSYDERWVDDGYKVKVDQEEGGNQEEDGKEVKAAQHSERFERGGKSVEMSQEIKVTLIPIEHETRHVEAEWREHENHTDHVEAECGEHGNHSTSSPEKRWVDDGYKVKADQEEDGNNSESSHEERWNKEKVAQLPDMFGGDSKSVETAQEIKITEIAENHETHHVKAEWREHGNHTDHVEEECGEHGNHSMSSPEKRWVADGYKVKADQKEDGNNFESSHEERWNKEKVAQLPDMFGGESKSVETAQEINITEIAEKHETHQSTLTMEEKKSHGTEKKDMQSEKEYFKNIDEAKEKEREREIEKMAVERAIREARERAFAEARERAERAAAERAAAEARRRVMAEGREKLGKTSAETKEKSLADKAAVEAKLKAERAAVERATVEARERALERAVSEKAARDNGRKQSCATHDLQHKGSCPPSNSRYPNLSHGVAHSTETSAGANEESSQRCKARSERHQRVAERAAKALAEKNMRDFLAQKEQAERYRLAESLDSDVKRWSKGKEGNLRALLSTLQYILGPDGGWQPIPLTDIITRSAVKKAYRKATLFVHPDKLQQRGASIQQKYTCEKVFDLLKEAWNRFDVEER